MPLPLLVRALDGWTDPADAFAALFARSTDDVVWLDSGPDADGGLSIIATGERVLTAELATGTVTVDGHKSAGDLLSTATALAQPISLDSRGRRLPAPTGWYGWIGYEAGAVAAGAPVSPSDTGTHDAGLLFAERLLVFDHGSRSVQLIAADDEEGRAWCRSTEARLEAAAGFARRYEEEHPVIPSSPFWRHDDSEYLRMIRAAQESIRAGDAYQLCVTNRVSAATDADPLSVHLSLRRASPAHHAGFLRIAGEVLVSSSPELFLQVDPDGRVRTKPIKGTRPRGATLAADLALRSDLEASEKEQAENVMIVDLMRNDLGRVCRTGSVEVRHLLEVESYAHVHQLVSTVEGRLRPGLSALDALRACFPAGSMTGAPKLSAMRILHELERGPRGAYSGCFGYLGSDGSADLAMVIRSIRFAQGTAEIGSGGGITALSVPEAELEEVRVKARALLTALGAAGPLGTD
ncbi:aminodeoxychorismate synthase component I [Leifsonia sp. AG29]|uniref:aminodeoxychorismate synthase component I n=1 Tax=Leifsonia sp. AG29 TaxID=2598860 RepID=UPI00131ACE84|nr:aminodeoxychorismate synthase component I [Leifsonia sp. AG29]